MSKGSAILILGFVYGVLPFVGIPTMAKTVIAVILGVLLMGLGFLVREEHRLLSGRNTDSGGRDAHDGKENVPAQKI